MNLEEVPEELDRGEEGSSLINKKEITMVETKDLTVSEEIKKISIKDQTEGLEGEVETEKVGIEVIE